MVSYTAMAAVKTITNERQKEDISESAKVTSGQESFKGQ